MDSPTWKFYHKKIPDNSAIELDLGLVLGIGGESIILKSSEKIGDEDFGKSKSELAVKASPCDVPIGGSIGFIDARFSKEKGKLPELIPTNFKHKNIIRYWRSLFQKVDPTLYHLSGKLKIYMKF